MKRWRLMLATVLLIGNVLVFGWVAWLVLSGALEPQGMLG
jgi:hypothetical protein